MDIFDVAIIGGGPGGYVCAIRSAQLGLRVALVEKRSTLGGTCVNVGCIPSKALLDSSLRFKEIQESSAQHGILVDGLRLDFAAMMARKSQVVKELTDGLSFLMKKNKITVFPGHGKAAKEEDRYRIDVLGDTPASLQAKKLVLATGSEPVMLPGVAVDGRRIITSDHVFSLDVVPERMAVLGAGIIGLEIGSVFARLGSRLTVIEALPAILPTVDSQLRELVGRSLKKQGLEILLGHKVTRATVDGEIVRLELDNGGAEPLSMEVDLLLVAVGRKPHYDKENLQALGLQFTDRGRIDVNAQTLETSVPGVYAIGDVIDGPMLAHRAEEDGVIAAERMAGKPSHANYEFIPAVAYIHPELAWVGKTESELVKAGVDFKTGRFMFRPNGRAKAMGEPEGMVKLYADKHTDKFLGACVFGPAASELIAELVFALEFGASAEDIGAIVHAHPTLSEAIKEAALGANGKAIHS